MPYYLLSFSKNSGSYVLIVLLASILMCSCIGEYPATIDGIYELDYEANGDDVIVKKGGEIVILGDVLFYNSDSNYIIAEQKPRDIIERDLLKNRNITQDEVDSCYAKSPIRQYWIIDKKADSVYGPFKKTYFEERKRQLGISKGLDIKV